jgi:hypothetical protein
MLNQSINNLNLQPCPLPEDHNEGGRSAQFPLPLISFPRFKVPVHINKDRVRAFLFAHHASHGLHTYTEACINYYVLHLLTGTVNYFVASALVVMLSIKVNCIKTFVFL